MLCARFWVRQVRLYGQGEALPSWAEGCGNVHMQSVVFTILCYVFDDLDKSFLWTFCFINVSCMPVLVSPLRSGSWILRAFFHVCLCCKGRLCAVSAQCQIAKFSTSLQLITAHYIYISLQISLQSQTIQQFSTEWIIPIKRIRQHYWPGKSEEANATCFWCKANSGSCN